MNLDEFNALVSSFYSDADRALALQGLTLGCNGGACPDGAPDAFRRACELGSGWRTEAEEYRTGRAENGAKGGRPKSKPCGSQMVPTPEPHGNHNETQSPIPNPLPEQPKIQPPPKAQKPARKDKTQKSLDGILGDHKESYWKLVALFGPTKNPAPKTTARLYVNAITAFPPEQILAKAQALVHGTSDPKYLPQLARWLEGEGYRNPDSLPKMAPASKTSRAHEADASFLAQLDGLGRVSGDYLGQNQDFFKRAENVQA